MEDYIKALNKRIAVKEFDATKKIDTATFERIIENTILSPSAFGLQAWNMLVIQKQSLKKILYPYANYQKQVLDCSHFVIFSQRKTLDEDYVEEHVRNTAVARNLTISKAKDLKNHFMGLIASQPQSEIDHWLAKQAYLSLGWLLTVASIEGVDTCPMEGFSKKDFDRELNLTKAKYRTTVACAMGYRDPKGLSSTWSRVRRPKDNLVNYY